MSAHDFHALAKTCADKIVEHDYYVNLWARVKHTKPIDECSVGEALKPFQDFWELLPDSIAIHRPPFSLICELAGEYCQMDPEALARTVDQTIANAQARGAQVHLVEADYSDLESRVLTPTTIITGCELVDPSSNRIAHGDLWRCGDVFFFNAVLSDGETAWKPNNLTPDQLRDRRIITLKPEVNYFERRGIIIFPTAWGQLNTGALTYLQGFAPPTGRGA